MLATKFWKRTGMAAISRDERSPNHQVAGTRNRIARSGPPGHLAARGRSTPWNGMYATGRLWRRAADYPMQQFLALRRSIPSKQQGNHEQNIERQPAPHDVEIVMGKTSCASKLAAGAKVPSAGTVAPLAHRPAALSHHRSYRSQRVQFGYTYRKPVFLLVQ